MKKWRRLGWRVNSGFHGLLFQPLCVGYASCAGRAGDVSMQPDEVGNNTKHGVHH